MTASPSVLPLQLGGGGYQISRSVRLRSSASANLTRTPSSAGNQQTWTWSGWVKRGLLSSAQTLLSTNGTTNTTFAQLSYSSDQLSFGNFTSAILVTNAVYRDPSAWYHIVVLFDSTQATATNRLRMFLNGVEITSFATDNRAAQIAQNTNYGINSTQQHSIGVNGYSATQYFDGYLAEVNFIGGQALTASSFGYTDSNGIWQPKAYTGTYGTNGFYLKFTDNSAATAAAIGKDYSGNGNNWTPNNISVTAGTTYDSMIDSPTVGYAASNYAVLNPLTLAGSGTGSVTNANLTLTSPSGDSTGAQLAGSVGISGGKFYWEETFTTLTSAAGYLCAGIQDATVNITGLTTTSRAGANTWWVSDDGNYRANGGAITASGLGAFAAGDVAMIAVDASTGKGWIGKNGTWVGSPSAGTGNTFSSLPALIAPFAQAIRNTTTSSVLNANFGQRPFSYTPPSGFAALNTYNLPAATINNGATVMAASLWSGTGAAQNILNSGNNAANRSFQPDFVWIKSRSGAASHNLVDSVRGSHAVLLSDLTSAEQTSTATSGVTSFNANGLSLGTDTSTNGQTNANGVTFVGWQWQAGQGTTSSNTNGSITSTVSVNQSAGFSVVTYTGNGVNGASYGHGLGVAPKFIISKSRNNANADAGYWDVYHSSLAAQNSLFLQTTGAAVSAPTVWISAPTSTVVNIGNGSGVNAGSSATYVAYCWSEVAGYSKFGSYTGNGSTDGPFIFCGFRPRWVMVKYYGGTSVVDGPWVILDTSRDVYNVAGNQLYANSSSAEGSAATVDILSNGFKFRGIYQSYNNSGTNYVFAAFAENPFNISRAR